MFNLRVMRRVCAPVGTTAASMFIVSAAKPPPPPPPPKDCNPDKPLVRPRDLPIYSNDPPCYTELPPLPEEEPNAVRDAITVGRKHLIDQLENVKGLKSKFWQTINTGKAHTEATLAMLREEENATLRYGSIGGGGFVGLVLGLRGGIFKKLVYTSAGALGMASLCYPEEASHYSSEGFRVARRYYSIGYHFLTGVLKDMGVEVPSVGSPLETVKGWIGLKDTIRVPGGSALLPPMPEQPSHVKQAPASSPSSPGAIPMPPLEKPSSQAQMKA